MSTDISSLRQFSQAEILSFDSRVVIPATTSVFVPKEKFVVGAKIEGRVPVTAIGAEFEDWFLGNTTEVEEPIEATRLCGFKLLKASDDTEILVKRGVKIREVITGLTHVHSVIEQCPNGIEAGRSYLFYVPQVVTKIGENRFSYTDRLGDVISEDVLCAEYFFLNKRQKWCVLRAVRVSWKGGWELFAFFVDDSRPWEPSEKKQIVVFVQDVPRQ